MLILTGQRREEVAGMTWDEISPDLSTWTIPASRAKNNVAHVVPLTPEAQDVLRKALRFARDETVEARTRRRTKQNRLHLSGPAQSFQRV